MPNGPPCYLKRFVAPKAAAKAAGEDKAQGLHDFLEQLGREVSLEKKRYANEKESTALKTAAEAAEKAAKASKAAEADKAKKQ